MMERVEYLKKYMFDWDIFDVIIGGKSALDSKFFVGPERDRFEVDNFLRAYGFETNDPIVEAELFGNFQEALQFIKRYFLKEGNPEGLDYKIPNSFYRLTHISELFILAATREKNHDEDRLWAEVVLKVMHTILHIDKDLRTKYFSIVQTQIFDRFYKYVHRDTENNLALGIKGTDEIISLIDFETKSKKSRDSVIIKLLHKAENVAEELFDRIGIRFVVENRLDALRLVKFLVERNIVIPHNIKPSRSLNSLVDIQKFKERHQVTLKTCLRNNLTEERFSQALERDIDDCHPELLDKGNTHSASGYRSIQFTGRQLIKYTNPFLTEFNELRALAKEKEDNELATKILGMDTSLVSRDIRFFYPFEVQIMDKASHIENTEGEASHEGYKKSQLRSAMMRVFKSFIERNRD